MSASTGVVIRGVPLNFGGQLRCIEYLIDFNCINSIIGAATSGNINLFTTNRYSQFILILVKHNAQFAGGIAGTLKVSVGTTGTVTQLTAATADLVATAVADTAYQRTSSPDLGTVASTQIIMNVVSSSGNLGALTAGSVSVYVFDGNVTTPNVATDFANQPLP
jgi:hypothetical protein